MPDEKKALTDKINKMAKIIKKAKALAKPKT